jgi:hypothetical protein
LARKGAFAWGAWRDSTNDRLGASIYTINFHGSLLI